MRIERGCRVEIRYEIFDESGVAVDGDGPIAYVHGEGEILPGLERALDGRESGDELELTLDADDAFGPYDPEGVIPALRSQFPADCELERGMSITIDVGFDEGETEMLEMRVIEVNGDEVVLDGNHPLAGQRVTFKVEVTSVARVAPGEARD